VAITLSGELNFATTPGALGQASAALGAADTSAPIILDLSGVTRADSAGLALLLELTRAAQARGGKLQIEKSPPQVRKLAEFFGLHGLLVFN
jgi:phospholipid transport system transporter-binding protein